MGISSGDYIPDIIISSVSNRDCLLHTVTYGNKSRYVNPTTLTQTTTLAVLSAGTTNRQVPSYEPREAIIHTEGQI